MKKYELYKINRAACRVVAYLETRSLLETMGNQSRYFIRLFDTALFGFSGTGHKRISFERVNLTKVKWRDRWKD